MSSNSPAMFSLSRSGNLAPWRAGAGFTLIEVLVALAIVAIVLISALRAIGSMAQTQSDLHERLLASWSADNRLTELRLTHQWPDLGAQSYPCPQGRLNLVCTQTVSATPNPLFRRVEISVRERSEDAASLAHVIAIVANETTRSL